MFIRIIIALCFFLFISCRPHKSPETKVTENIAVPFEDKETGWSTRYPKNWKVMDKAEISEMEGKGQVAIQETLDEEILSDHRNILWLRKDQFNVFMAMVEPYDEAVDGPWDANRETVNNVLEETFRAQGLQFDSKAGSVSLDGLEFATMETVIYTPDRKTVILTQRSYDRFINQHMTLSFSISYNNETARKELEEILTTSKFSNRN